MGPILQGLLVGIIFGVVLQRGRICFNSAIRDVKLTKDNYLFKLIILAILVEIIGFQLLAQFGWIKLNPKPFMPVAQGIGGFLFGMGMVLAGGCASGITYRIGEGYITAFVAAVFYGVTAAAVKGGPLTFLDKLFRVPTLTTTNNPSNVYVVNNGKVNLTIANLLNVNPWIVAIISAIILLLVVIFWKTTERKVAGLNWISGGIALGIVGTIGYLSRKNYALGITGGWINLFRVTTSKLDLTKPLPYNWEGMEILGIIIGALIVSLIYKEFKLRMPKKPKTFLQVALGGILMGSGAAIAFGCNIGHILSGVPHLAISSLWFTIFTIAGNWLMVWYLFERR